MAEKIKFRNLSNWLKLAIITSWMILTIGSISFIWGFIEGFFFAG